MRNDERFRRVGLMWHGDREARQTASLAAGRFEPMANALRHSGLEPVPVVFNNDFADEAREDLRGLDAVLVWVNPIEQDRDRSVLDALLRGAADDGIGVSAHPDTILKMGTKEVLVTTRSMSWGSDTHLYTSHRQLLEQLPERLAAGSARVLKQLRGNGGSGVWKAERVTDDHALVRVRHAQRGSIETVESIGQFMQRLEPYFGQHGQVIDQAYQERLVDGMVRCYMVQDAVVGFGHQAVNALFPAPPGVPPEQAPQPGPRLYHPPDAPQFEPVRRKMEEDWLDAMCRTTGVDRGALPMIWDADLLYGPKTTDGEDTYVLCEINVSSVYPYPDSAVQPLAERVSQWIQSRPRQAN
ncbi:MAG: Cj0069 family protein [Armatimonadetes bacterium]|nr:Cj0069 family protein [Armatimonadota bacterium]MDE2207292.1 Cj0069 family protein [Armatimonadota bacterium]